MCLVGQREEVDLTQFELANYLPVVLKDAVAFVVELRVWFYAAVVLNKGIKDCLCHENEVDTFSESILNLVILPLKFDPYFHHLIVLLGFKKFTKANQTRVVAGDRAQVD